MRKNHLYKFLMFFVMIFLFAGCGKKEADYIEVSVEESVFDDKFS